jgi:N-acetylglucosaminyldiphosphoundecaprenol N-acetyl-beta-D-mannosaminyltransferase
MNIAVPIAAKELPMISLHGVTLHAITEAQAVAHVIASLDVHHGGVVVTPNLDHLRRCRLDPDFAELVSRADLAVADGMPLVWASRLQGTPVPQRVAGSNLISSLSAAAAASSRSIFLLGGAAGTAEAAGQLLRQRYPGLVVAGQLCPPIGFENDPEQIRAIGDALVAARPDIVFVALGSPKQERLIAELRPLLPSAWWLGVGISFSFLTGDVKRAPQWMQRIGIEWVHRLIQEPRRLFARYLIHGLPFAAGLFAKAAIERFSTQRHARSAAAGFLAANATDAIPQLRSGRGAGSETRSKQDAVDETPWSQTLIRPDVARLSEIILLGGSVRASGLARSAQRAIVDLPIDDQRTLLDQWAWQSAETARLMGRDRLPTRLLLSTESPLPKSDGSESITIERDANAFRGTGGALRDAASAGNDDDLLLVANAAQVMLDPLPLLLSALHRLEGDMAIIAHADGTPSGAMLLPRAALKLIPTFGFIDFKEQALPIIAREFDVRVLRRTRATGLPVRSAAGYCAALRQYHRRRAGLSMGTDPLGEHWTSAFSIIEPGAMVSAGAQLHDAVVLEGARVEAGATVVRCIICPGGIVRRGQTVVDELIAPPLAADQKRRAA